LFSLTAIGYLFHLIQSQMILNPIMTIGMPLMPNQSPEPTADGAVSSAIAVHAARRRWLSFFR